MTSHRAGTVVASAVLVVAACNLAPDRSEPAAPPGVRDAAIATAPTTRRVKRTRLPPRPRARPRTPPDAAPPSRCPERARTTLRVTRRGETIIDADATNEIARRGHRPTNGPLAGRAVLSLSALSHGAPRVELVPCVGPPLVLEASERYVLTPNQRGMIKLVDLGDTSGRHKPLARNLAVVRLLDR